MWEEFLFIKYRLWFAPFRWKSLLPRCLWRILGTNLFHAPNDNCQVHVGWCPGGDPPRLPEEAVKQHHWPPLSGSWWPPPATWPRPLACSRMTRDPKSGWGSWHSSWPQHIWMRTTALAADVALCYHHGRGVWGSVCEALGGPPVSLNYLWDAATPWLRNWPALIGHGSGQHTQAHATVNANTHRLQSSSEPPPELRRKIVHSSGEGCITDGEGSPEGGGVPGPSQGSGCPVCPNSPLLTATFNPQQV